MSGKRRPTSSTVVKGFHRGLRRPFVVSELSPGVVVLFERFLDYNVNVLSTQPPPNEVRVKTQFLATESLRLVFLPFFHEPEGMYVGMVTDVATVVVKKPDGALLLPAPTLVFESDLGFWVGEIPVGDYMQGDWCIKATLNVVGTFPQYRVFTWGDYVDDLSHLRKVGTGRWKIDTGLNRLRFYDENGTTILYEFDLKDAAGLPNSSRVYERVPV